MKLRVFAVAVVLACFALASALARTPLLRMYEDKTLDSRFSWRHRVRGPEPCPAIRVIGIDDDSLTALDSRWPVPWHWHALLLEALSDRLPAAVAYNILFISARGQDARDEEKLAAASRRLGDVVYPYYFDFENPGATGRSPYRSPGEAESAKEMLRRTALRNVKGDLRTLPLTVDVTMPVRPLAAHASLGFANAGGDEDGVVRRMPLVLRFEDRVYPSFALMAALRYYNAGIDGVSVNLGRCVEFDIAGGPHVAIPIDRTGAMRINYAARLGEFSHSLFAQVVQSYALRQEGHAAPVDLADFEEKLVLVGVTATGAIEAYMKPTPLSPETPLLAAYANTLGTILTRAFPREIGVSAAAALLLLTGAATGALTASFRAATSLALAAALFAVYLAAAYVAFIAALLILPIVPGALIVVFVYTLVTSYRYATEERQRKFLRGALGRYLSRNVMEAILRNPDELRFGGERKELTVLFADVKGFTGFCERSPVEDVAPRLNEIHNRMTRIIWKHDGTLDKYMGDGLMAFWGAPLPQKDHAKRAVRAAVEMTEELGRMRASWESRGIEPFSMGIGVNTGSMIVGNMGSNEFWDYTVLGDEVNLGARLEKLTRAYGVSLIISESTRRSAEGIVETKLLGEVTVKGKQKPVVIFEVAGKPREGGASQLR